MEAGGEINTAEYGSTAQTVKAELYVGQGITVALGDSVDRSIVNHHPCCAIFLGDDVWC